MTGIWRNRLGVVPATGACNGDGIRGERKVMRFHASTPRLRTGPVNANSIPTGSGAIARCRGEDRRRGQMGSDDPKPVLRWAFYVLVFSLPFENVPIGVESGSLSLSKI